MAKEKQQDDGDDVPAWIVSFSDMVTLLLAFFVLLQAFATTRSPDLFYAGQGSFKRAIHGLGIPDLLLGKRYHDQKDWRRIKYPMEEDPENRREQQVRDADEDKIRELFDQLRKEAFNVEATNVGGMIRNVYPTTVQFQGRSTLMAADSRAELDRVMQALEQYINDHGIVIYVLGYGSDIPEPTLGWAVAARRAQAVEGYIRRGLARKLQDEQRLRAWGTGPNSQWGRRFRTSPSQQIVIVAVQEP